MFIVMSSDYLGASEISVVCDNLAEAQSPRGIIGFFQGNNDFEDAEVIAIHVLDETEGVKLIQKVFIHPRTLEQEQAEQEAAEAIKVLEALLLKRRLLCTATQVHLIDLVYRWNDTLQDA